MRAAVVCARRSGTQRPHAVPRARAGGAAASTSIWSASKARRCRARSPTSRASPSTASTPPTLRLRGESDRLDLRRRRPVRRAARSSFRLWRTLRRLPQPDLVLVQNPPAFPTLAVTLVLAAAPRRPVRHRLAQPRLHAAAAAARPVASGGAAGALVRAARRAPRRREPVRVARPGRVSREPLRREARAACSTTGRRRCSRRSSAPSASSFRQALFARLGIHAGTVGFIVCPTSWTEDEDFDVVIDAVLRLEERIRGWEARRSGAAVSRARDPGDRRRRAARRVRAALRRAAGAARSSCARAGSSPRTIRASSAAPISACACTAPRRASTSR